VPQRCRCPVVKTGSSRSGGLLEVRSTAGHVFQSVMRLPPSPRRVRSNAGSIRWGWCRPDRGRLRAGPSPVVWPTPRARPPYRSRHRRSGGYGTRGGAISRMWPVSWPGPTLARLCLRPTSVQAGADAGQNPGDPTRVTREPVRAHGWQAGAPSGRNLPQMQRSGSGRRFGSTLATASNDSTQSRSDSSKGRKVTPVASRIRSLRSSTPAQMPRSSSSRF